MITNLQNVTSHTDTLHACAYTHTHTRTRPGQFNSRACLPSCRRKGGGGIRFGCTQKRNAIKDNTEKGCGRSLVCCRLQGNARHCKVCCSAARQSAGWVLASVSPRSRRKVVSDCGVTKQQTSFSAQCRLCSRGAAAQFCEKRRARARMPKYNV